ncbi:MAG: response regulator [Polyangiaceae bacterium]|nr:response regulator [Polyangiaceae bacterium]
MKPHILVVDDSMIVRMDLRGSLTAAGFDVTVCETKRAAEELLDKQSYSAIVLDVMLPDGDGVELLRRVRDATPHADTPVIMLSAEAEIRDRVRGLSMGADEYVGKPYNIAYFIGRVRDLCRARRGHEQLEMPVIACRRILVVDDSPTFLQYLAKLLREDGHDVVLAHSGTAALEILAVQTIDCVVIDRHMPDIDGLETLRRIRQAPACESTPIIMLTGTDDLTVERAARDAGADAFVHKTDTRDVIRSRVRRVLRGGRTSPAPPDAVSNIGSSNARRSSPQDSTRRAPPSPYAPLPSPMPYSTGATRSQPKELNPLFVEAASAMGLNTQLARDTLAKALGRMSIDPQRMDCADLARTLPALREALRMFFSPDELMPRIEALTSIAMRSGSKTR